MRRLRLILTMSLAVSSLSFVSASPASACVDPDQPSCQVGQAVCQTTEPLAKYRDKIVNCYPY